jgi:hypothetical protein
MKPIRLALTQRPDPAQPLRGLRRMLRSEDQSDGIGRENPHPAVNALIAVSDQESGQLVDARAK